MGCDMEAWVESFEDGVWTHVATFGESGGYPRQYCVFAALAGVRNTYGLPVLHEPRGMPDDADALTKDKALDCHTVSWLTPDEWSGALHRLPDDLEADAYYWGIYAFAARFPNARIVFGFDS